MPWYISATLGQSDNPPSFSFVNDDEVFDDMYGMPDHIIPEAHWPVEITQDTPHETIPDYTVGPYTNYILVSAAFKSAVEELELGVHHFMPVKLTKPDGAVEEGGHFIFAVGQWTDNALLADKSSVSARNVRGKFRGYELTSLQPKLMWDKGAVGGLHVWSDRTLRTVVMVSDTLYETLQNRGIDGYLAMESRME